MRILFDRIDFESIQLSLGGESPLLLLCDLSYFNVAKLTLLLRRGATVHDRSARCRGETCLHSCLAFSGILKGNSYFIGNIRDGLVYLIQQGADVRAKDDIGVSVSDVAYGVDTRKLTFRSRIREDVWDCVLTICGYDISDFRRRPRQAIYSPTYSRMDFEELWAGYEHLCPYYDDKDNEIYLSDIGDTDDDYDDEDCCRGSSEEAVVDSGDENGEMGWAEDEDWSDSEDGGVGLDPTVRLN